MMHKHVHRIRLSSIAHVVAIYVFSSERENASDRATDFLRFLCHGHHSAYDLVRRKQ